jgi:hypothetical protein
VNQHGPQGFSTTFCTWPIFVDLSDYLLAGTFTFQVAATNSVNCMPLYARFRCLAAPKKVSNIEQTAALI